MQGTAANEHELKAEGVAEAARDPGSNVTADDAEKALIDQARAGGAAAFTFDPNATPAEKAAAAKEVGNKDIFTRMWKTYPKLTHFAAGRSTDTPETPDRNAGD